MIKKLIALLVIFGSLQAQGAVCDYTNDIKDNGNGTYTYTRGCHIEVGKAVKSVSLLDERIDLMQKQIDLKDLQISKYDERVQLWMDTSYKLNDKIMTYEATKSNDKWIAFGLGVGLTVLSVWAAGQLR